MSKQKLQWSDPVLQTAIDAAFEACFDLQSGWPATPIGQTHPNDLAYTEALTKLWRHHLLNTGWTLDEVDHQIENIENIDNP
jgi:hypothetical protein